MKKQVRGGNKVRRGRIHERREDANEDTRGEANKEKCKKDLREDRDKEERNQVS